MNILQRYILRELVGPVVLSILFFSFILLLRQLFRFAETLLEAGVGFGSLVEIIAVVCVTLMIITIPMAALMGCLIGIGRLTSENEILAMRVSGISLYKVFWPVFVVAALGSVGLMWSGFDFLPAMTKRLTDKREALLFQMITNLEPGRNYDNLSPRGSDISLFFEQGEKNKPGDGPYTLRMKQVAMRVEGKTEGLTGADLSSKRDSNRETLFFAKEGIIRGDFDKRSVRIELADGTVLPLDQKEPSKEVRVRFANMSHVISPGTEADAIPRLDRIDPRQLSLGELRSLVATTPTSDFYTDAKRRRITPEWTAFLNARNELCQRFTLPWSLLAFVLIAVPLAVELRPAAKTYAFILSLGLIITYYVMNTWAGAIGMMQGSSGPLTLLFYMLPNLLIGGIGILLFWRSQR